MSVCQLRPKPERHEGLPEDIRVAIEDRFAKIEEKLQRNQQQTSRWQEDSLRDFQAVEAYLTRVHTMVKEMQQTEGSSSDPSRPRMTKLSAAARKGDLRVEVESPDVCRVGEVVLLGEQEATMVVDKSSLVFRFPIEREYPEGTVIRPLAENEFIQSEGDHLCVYRRGPDDDIHYICRVDLLERVTPERGSEVDEPQEHAYGEDLEARIQRIIEAREAAQSRSGGVSGVMVLPLSSAHEWRQPLQARAVDLPIFGQGTDGQSRREEVQGAEQGRSADQGHAREANAVPYVRVKQEEDSLSPLDEYFCKGMDTSGPAAWATVLQDMASGNLPEVGQLNAREGVREEKWVSFDQRTVKFPSTQTSSVRRATLIQNFEADFTRAMGIISLSAALYAQAVIAGVQQDLPIYRRRDVETTAKDWTMVIIWAKFDLFNSYYRGQVCFFFSVCLKAL